MRKEIDRVFTALAFQVMGWRHALVTMLLYIPCTRVHSRFIFKNTVGQISIFGKTGN